MGYDCIRQHFMEELGKGKISRTKKRMSIVVGCLAAIHFAPDTESLAQGMVRSAGSIDVPSSASSDAVRIFTTGNGCL